MNDLTVIIHTRNESEQIADCIRSCAHPSWWVLVADMESTDRTVEIARRNGAQTLALPLQPEFDRARNDSAAAANTEWILYIDADERLTSTISATVRSLIASADSEVAGFQLPYKTYSFGKWIEHAGGWWPSYKSPALLRRGRFRFPGPVHVPVEVDGIVVRVVPKSDEDAIIHYSHRSLEHYIEKLNRYTDLEQLKLRDSAVRSSWERSAQEFGATLSAFYDTPQGFRDGLEGFLLSLGSGLYDSVAHLKAIEGQRSQDVPNSSEAFWQQVKVGIDSESHYDFPRWVVQFAALLSPLGQRRTYPANLISFPQPESVELGLSAVTLGRPPGFALEIALKSQLAESALVLMRDTGLDPGEHAFFGLHSWHRLETPTDGIWWFTWNDAVKQATSRVDFQLHSAALDVFGGGEVQAFKTLQALRRKGVISNCHVGDCSGHAPRHLFSLHHSPPSGQYVLSPIYWDRTELHWVVPKLKAAFATSDQESEIEGSLLAIRSQRDSLDRAGGFLSNFDDRSTEIISNAQCVLPNAQSELERIERGLGKSLPPSTIVCNAIPPDVAEPNLFLRETGLRNFVLCVGRLEWNKNQAIVAWSLRDLDLPLVFIGKSLDQEYFLLCKNLADEGAVFLGAFDHRMVQSAYAAAAVHVLVGFGETPGLANLEAAAQGCPIVVSTRGAERDYFGDLAHYADPLDPKSIRDSVESALQAGRGERTAELQRIVRESYTWDRAAEATLAVYQEFLFGQPQKED